MRESLLLGVDVGTSSTKSIVVDSKGNMIGQGSHGYETNGPHPGWVEQDPECWIEGLKESVKQAIESSGADWAQIRALSITHQRYTIVPVDTDFNPIYPAIVWSDTRSSEEVNWATDSLGAENIFRRTGCVPGLWSIYKVLWLKRNRSDLYNKAHMILMVPDWLIHKLTGGLVTSESSAATSGALDIVSKREWDTDLLKELGLRSDLFIHDIRRAGTVVGEVTKEAERVFGIPSGIRVVIAAGDQPCGSLGAGQFETGSLSINGGTSCTSEILSSTLPSLKHTNYFVEISPTGKYILESAIYTGGSALMNWYRRNFGASEEIIAKKEGKNIWDVIYDLPTRAPIGNLGLVLVPFLGGAGPPFWDLDARGAFIGLSTDHGREHMVRAIIEGLAYETRRETGLMQEDITEPITSIINYGGSTRSPVWNQTFADINNKVVYASSDSETTALGAAMCAGVGAGVYPDVVSAAQGMSAKMLQFHPQRENSEFYDVFYSKVYVGLYDAISEKVAKARRLALSIT